MAERWRKTHNRNHGIQFERTQLLMKFMYLVMPKSFIDSFASSLHLLLFSPPNAMIWNTSREDPERKNQVISYSRTTRCHEIVPPP